MDRVFDFDGASNIIEEDGFGIVNGRLTAGIDYRDVGTISGLWAPPYVSSDFRIEVQVAGVKGPVARYMWRPFEVERVAEIDGLKVTSVTSLLYGTRAGLLAVTIENAGGSETRKVPIRFAAGGTLDRTNTWEFQRATSQTAAPATFADGQIVKRNGPCMLAIQIWGGMDKTDLAALETEVEPMAGKTAKSALSMAPPQDVWTGEVNVAAGATGTVYIAFAIGPEDEPIAACRTILDDPKKALRETRAEYARRVRELFGRLPALESSNPALEKLYYRSLVHLLTNRWDVPEFVLHPYYGTGSVKGGCVCNYLWNFGEVWEILPLYDPAATREHIKQFLKTDLTAHFAFNPIGGEALGPWYPVNQEKIIGLTYYYVLTTGDAAFLDETVAGKTVREWIVSQALYGDATDRPVALIDYGPSNSHLELRRGYPYNHVMPDLNGRRYANYLMAARLCDAEQARLLRQRAEALKILLKEKLWDGNLRWFHFVNGEGALDTRYTMQIFKLIGSGVLDGEEEAGLLSHLNETEFFSEFGFHSMSKLDPAYDQVDIDNGGGGSCTCFPPQIAERLYKSGRADRAGDILKRILWWGERMPYWGDSLVANSVDYRKDTPLQCTLDGATVAQCIIFGLFGIEPRLEGGVRVNPHAFPNTESMRLKNVRIRGMEFDVSVTGGSYEVRKGAESVKNLLGTPIELK